MIEKLEINNISYGKIKEYIKSRNIIYPETLYFISIITSFCARIYSKRRASRKTEQFIEELKNESNRNSSD